MTTDDLYAQYAGYVATIVRSRVPWPDAEDVKQDVWLRVTRAVAAGRFDGQHPMAWLKRIAINRAFDYYREPHLTGELGEWIRGSPDDIETVDPAIIPALTALREPWRRAVLLAVVGYGSSEAAALMGLRDVTYRVYLWRGRQQLRAQLQEAV